MGMMNPMMGMMNPMMAGAAARGPSSALLPSPAYPLSPFPVSPPHTEKST